MRIPLRHQRARANLTAVFLGRAYFTWIDRAPTTLKFTATTGLIFRNKGGANLDLFPEADAEMKLGPVNTN